MIESDQNNPNNPNLLDDEIDLKELFNAIWEGKKIIILITSIFATCSIVFSLLLPNYYSSESILIARDSKDSGNLSQYAGLASLAGVSLPNSSDNEVFEVMEIIQSREFVKHLITFESVLPSIMASKSYDAALQELYFDPKLYNAKTKIWESKTHKNQGTQPSYLEAHKVYLNMLSISQNKMTGLIYITIEHISPIFAKDFLTLIIKEANTLNREIDIDNSSKALSYLKKQLSQTSLLEIKKSISQLIEAQLETQMIASIHDEYSLISLEPPFIPEEKSKPSRSLVVILGTVLGGMLSVMMVLVRHFNLGRGTIDK